MYHYDLLNCFLSFKVQPPVSFWDPVGLSADGDVTLFKHIREVRLKNGRSRHMCFTNFDIMELSHRNESLVYTHIRTMCRCACAQI